MPGGAATVDPTVTSEVAIFQSDKSVLAIGLDGGGLITAPGDGEPIRGIRISCPSASAATLRVRIPGIHGTGQYAFVKAGETQEFINNLGASRTPGIDVVYVSSTGTATYNYTVFAR